MEYFNRYAYIEIGMSIRMSLFYPRQLTLLSPALYGKTYLNAAKDTWGLFVDRGIDALVNDSLVGMSKSTA